MTTKPAPAEIPPTDDSPRSTLAEDLVAALGELHDVARSSTADAGSYSYRYAELADVLTMSRPILAAHGLALLTLIDCDAGTVIVTARFLHRSGDTLDAGTLTMGRGSTPQATGSAITYARRYLALAALSLATDDDDGRAAANPAPSGPAPAPPADDPAVVTFDRVRTAGADPATADTLKALAAEQGRKLSAKDFATYPEWRSLVSELLDAIEQMPAPDANAPAPDADASDPDASDDGAAGYVHGEPLFDDEADVPEDR
jgi:hypothetical protein